MPTGDYVTVEYVTVEPYVNDVPLLELARPVEQPYADLEGHPRLAGDYAGLHAGPDLVWPSRHFLDQPWLTWFPDNATILLGCKDCGMPGCWPLTARIDVEDDVVVWHHFHTGHPNTRLCQSRP
ncbi:hypothetical protein I6A84_11235 [Frankia sp. CNm7]|uniref:Uncharacterized protein n=1 Tax=Frankia nepalensis TaxID=1836974 RepID=A0A937UPC0_9ACTN|nr:hypothetical protein [Frankia nepalensis]MBL7498342.1 hypothetical protein [Frankia nepalensis]MBL7514990.1 hypothetical protein [Frankia nepalensis]MBL7518669.1 hypothetical protein [Frankia nepalensis]MBL7628933.1 hypothetical protein [Frankia nepalensis]